MWRWQTAVTVVVAEAQIPWGSSAGPSGGNVVGPSGGNVVGPSGGNAAGSSGGSSAERRGQLLVTAAGLPRESSGG